MNRRGLIFIMIGAAAALAAALVVFALNTNADQNLDQRTLEPTPVVNTVDIVVAAVNIESNTVISSSMLTKQAYPVDLIPNGAFTDTTEVSDLESTTKTRVFAGQPILRQQFVIGAGGREGSSINVPKGKVLVAFPSTDILNSTGAVQPGDHVDILLSMPISGTARLDAGAGTESQLQGAARTIVAQATLQDVEVYTVGQWNPPNQAGGVATGLKIITFHVDPQEALILKFIKDSGGAIDLVVRSLEDNKPVATDPVNLDYIVDLYKFIGLPKPGTP